jgi:Fur family iron response transcriptional regulator
MNHSEIPRDLLKGSNAEGEEEIPSSCPVSGLKNRLRKAGLRPTRQRMLLGWLLFSGGNRHVSAEVLFQESQAARSQLSLATVYNTLGQFSDAGLLRKVAAFGDRVIYDTCTGDHHHFLVEADGTVLDISDEDVGLSHVPEPPPGYRVTGVDVVVRLERIKEGA